MPLEGSGSGDSDMQAAIDTGWILITAFNIFFMQCGFAMLEAGATRAKNTKNIILKKVINPTLGLLIFWGVGYAFAFGKGPLTNRFIGFDDFFLYKEEQEDALYAFFFFQWCFAITGSTILIGALAERTQFTSYMFINVIVMAWIYPVPAHWVWAEEGWLRNIGTNGFIDFAGGAVVHMMGGAIGLIGAAVVGPREGRFDPTVRSKILKRQKPVFIPAHSAPLVALGDFILWFGWLSFNCGSTLGLTNGRYQVAGMIAVNTVLCSSTSLFTALIVSKLFISKQYSMEDCFNALLAGAVAITPACSSVDTWGAFLTGIGSAIVYLTSSRALVLVHVDDPLDAVAIHFGPGMWGLVSVGLFSTQDNIAAVYGPTDVYGLFLGGGTEQLGIQLLGISSLVLWQAMWSIPLFLILHWFKMLRVDHDTEVAGLDNTKHGGTAYPDFTINTT